MRPTRPVQRHPRRGTARRLLAIGCWLVLVLIAAASTASAQSHAPLSVVPAPPTSAYEATHGRVVNSPLAPYVIAYLERAGIDTSTVLASLLPTPEPADPFAGEPLFISSAPHVRGNWTYYRSVRTQIFEALALDPPSDPRVLFVLFHVEPAGRMSIDDERYEMGWRLGAMTASGTLLATADLTALLMARAPQAGDGPPGQWPWGDMVTTSLTYDGAIEVSIAIAQTGHTAKQPEAYWVLVWNGGELVERASGWR
ncbi:MAG: hypothetical protein R3E10_06605 [Gemmatimonadota bacterium]